MIEWILLTAMFQDKNLEKDPDVVIGKVMGKYMFAKSLNGTIVQTINDGSGGKTITTQVSYIRPDKILIQQDYVGRNGLKANLTSNGTKFVYDPPLRSNVPAKPRERLYEPVVIPHSGTDRVTVLAIGDMYHAAHLSLAPSTFLDFAVGFKKHLEDFKINVASTSLVGVETLTGKSVYHISGLWQPYIGATPTGRYDLWVTTEFELVKFVLKETYNVQNRAVQLTTTETANLTIGANVNQAIFRVD